MNSTHRRFTNNDIGSSGLLYYALLIISFVLLSCHGNSSETLNESNSEGFIITEKNLGEYYDEVEAALREEHGITDDSRITTIMQLLIDEGDIYESFIVEKTEDEARIRFVSYREYKEYYKSHSRDSLNVFTISFDSLFQGK